MDIQAISGSANPITAVTGTDPTTMTSPPPTPHLNGTLDGIAQQLSLSPGALKSALRQGSSITDLAQQRGVSRSNLVNSVESQIQQKRSAAGQSPLDQTTLDRMVNRAFDRHRGGHHVHAPTQAQSTTQPAPRVDPATGGIDTLA